MASRPWRRSPSGSLPAVPAAGRVLRSLLPALLLLGIAAAPAVLAQENLRNTFPGRRVGGGTRGECSARVVANLVPSTSVFSPGASRRIGVLEGPTANPRPLRLAFRPLNSSGSSDTARAAMSQRMLPASPAGVTLVTLPALKVPTVWESSFACEEGTADPQDPLAFVQSESPPAVSLLVADADSTPEDKPLQAALQQLGRSCGASVPREQVASLFGLSDVITAEWPASLPVRCP
ncbi:MAG: hypothetical protein ACOVNL_02265 [Prochlorococcaceae cyanobacterium]|jgi:hypothetical protein